jgi:hypothetical protein
MPPKDFLSPSTLSSAAKFPPADANRDASLVDICLPEIDKRQEFFVVAWPTKVKCLAWRRGRALLRCSRRRLCEGHRIKIQPVADLPR